MKKTSWNFQIGTGGIRIKNYIDFTKLKKLFIQNKKFGKGERGAPHSQGEPYQ